MRFDSPLALVESEMYQNDVFLAYSGLSGNRGANSIVFFFILIESIYEVTRIPIDTLSHCTVPLAFVL